MTGLQRLTGKPIAWVRSIMEITVVLLGWVLGGNAGIGTILFAVGIGPAVAFGLYLASYFPKKDENLVMQIDQKTRKEQL